MGPQAVQSLPAGRLQEQKGGRARGTALDRKALVWVLSALSQVFRIPFDEKLVTGQLSLPYDLESVARAAGSLDLRAGWKALPASKLKKLTAPFAVTLAPVCFSEPQRGSGVDRERLASLDAEAPVQRLAFLLRIEEGRAAFFEQGTASHTILPLAEFESRYAGRVLQATPKTKPLADPDAQGAAREHSGFRWFVPELLKRRKVFRDRKLFRFPCLGGARLALPEARRQAVPALGRNARLRRSQPRRPRSLVFMSRISSA